MYSWDRTDLPHRGWLCEDMIDHDVPEFQCEMCGNPDVRYEHVMTHPEVVGKVGVGCVCAGHMEGSLKDARRREREAKKRAGRRETWVKSPK